MGNVGINTTPSGWGGTLDAIDVGAYGSFSADNDTTFITNNAYYNGSNWIYKNSNLAGRYRQQQGFHVWDSAASGTAGGTLSWSEAMRIDSSGNLLVGCTSFGSILTLGCQLGNDGTAIFSNNNDLPLYLNRVTGSTVYGSLVAIYRNDVQSGYIGAAKGGTPSFAAPSDIRLKNNVTDHESELTNLMALRPVRWDWKNETRGSGEGFVAQELEQTAWADLVSEDEDGYKIVSGLGVVETRLIKAIQELSAQVDELKAEVAALKGA